MLTEQEIFNKCANYLREHGNPYGSRQYRGWGFVNLQNPRERCVVASFCEGETSTAISNSFTKQYGTHWSKFQVVKEFMSLFDHEPIKCSDRKLLDVELQRIADRCSLVYTNEHEEQAVKEMELNYPIPEEIF